MDAITHTCSGILIGQTLRPAPRRFHPMNATFQWHTRCTALGNQSSP